MVMIYLNNTNIYYNTQVYFRKNCMSNLPNDAIIWALEYRKWLATQGAIIVSDEDYDLIRNSLGFAPGFDRFGFKNERDATLFCIKWA